MQKKINSNLNKTIFGSIFIVAGIASPSMALSEVITTTDGRQIELKLDGTYEVMGESKTELEQMVEMEPFLEHHQGEYNQNSMRFMPIFKNVSEKTIVGFKFRSEFKSAFGDEVFQFQGESSERVNAGATSTIKAFYFFEDNQFIAGEPYDKLKIFEAAGTGKISTNLTAIVFDDGEVIRLE